MRNEVLYVFLLCGGLLSAGCATSKQHSPDPLSTQQIEKRPALRELTVSRETEDKILALDPEHVSEREIREVLSQAPAPRIINIHGGVYPVYLFMKSFSQFLVGMGYPKASVRNPGDGTYSFSCYESSEKIAGMIAWCYESEGLAPIMVGHSQGGMQLVKVLRQLAGRYSKRLAVWNALTLTREERCYITDPLTGEARPVVGLQISYATAVGAGGLGRLLPNQWDMGTKLRRIPDSVEEFTGFYMGLDIFGGDFLGFGPLNKYKSSGKAVVRNVRLPIGYNHVTVPITKHLVRSQEIKDWINNYRPTDKPRLDARFDSSSAQILWAADVWHSIKKHWVLEVQRLILAKRALRHGD